MNAGNALGADEAYDPDPYAGREWHPDWAHQYAPDGTLDRRVAQRLEGPGRMVDCARAAGAEWQPTAGLFPVDPHPPRRIDRWYATPAVPDGVVQSLHAVEMLRGLPSDHRPVVVDIDPQPIYVAQLWERYEVAIAWSASAQTNFADAVSLRHLDQRERELEAELVTAGEALPDRAAVSERVREWARAGRTGRLGLRDLPRRDS